MSTRTISSPGVQINELDQSLIARPLGATTVFVTGFTNQGPTETPVNISSISEFEEVYGLPTNEAERYLYHSAKQILQTSPANLLVSRLPYGAGNGVGFENTYSALLFPISANALAYKDATEFTILPPNSLLLSDNQYDDLVQNKINWNSTMAGNSNVPYAPGVTCATTVSLSSTYFNGNTDDGVGATLTNAASAKAALVIDGYTVALNDLVLIKDQVVGDRLKNGVYKLTTVGTTSVNWILTRATDADTTEKLIGKIIIPRVGNTNANKAYTASLKTTDIVGKKGFLWTERTNIKGATLATTANLDYVVSGNTTILTNKVNGVVAIDGTNLTTVGTRVLVKNQADAKQNGVYAVTTPGTASVKLVLTRTSDLNTPATLADKSIYVDSGSTQADTMYDTTFKAWHVFGTHDVVWQAFGVPSAVNKLNAYVDNINTFDDLGNAGIIVLNSQKTTVNNYFEGYYVAISDNRDFNPSSDFTSIAKLKAVTSFGTLDKVQEYTNVPDSRLNFLLTQPYATFGGDSISKAVETASYATGFEKDDYRDSIVLTVFKIGATQYGKDTLTLDYSIVEGYNGSLYSGRTEQSQTSGPAVSRFLDTVVGNNSKYIKVLTNPYISDIGKWTTAEGTPNKRVIVDSSTKNAYSVGSYTGDADVDKLDIGNVPAKLGRILYRFENDENIDIDISAECGLGTIWASAKDMATVNSSTKYYFDEEYNLSLTGITTTDGTVPSGNAYNGYGEIANQFVALADKTRKDHMFIADPLRHIFVNGANTKTSSRRDYVFSNSIYWPLKNQFAQIQSSYVSVYGNWLKVSDNTSNTQIWVPSSGFAAAIYASTSQESFPWIAPAGFSRGTLINVFDVAINPTQKQRDLLYKINMNPIAFFNNDGFVIYGQKTMFKKPSAFDRVNVRRLFLTLEKETKALLKYFVFEPNTFATRNRLKSALLPIFDQAKLNDGLYDYQLICDERNNTPDVIDNNELKISIYIKPVRAAEFILADFVATRTGIDFSELNG